MLDPWRRQSPIGRRSGCRMHAGEALRRSPCGLSIHRKWPRAEPPLHAALDDGLESQRHPERACASEPHPREHADACGHTIDDRWPARRGERMAEWRRLRMWRPMWQLRVQSERRSSIFDSRGEISEPASHTCEPLCAALKPRENRVARVKCRRRTSRRRRLPVPCIRPPGVRSGRTRRAVRVAIRVRSRWTKRI